MDGGIVGYFGAESIENCYNAGTVKTNGGWFSNMAGGLVGQIVETDVINCYNYGEIISQGENVKTPGGIVGINGNSNGRVTITSSYYTDTSTTYSYWYNSSTHYTTGRVTESTLKGYASTLNEKDEEGNEIEVWVEDTGINNGYPILKWQIEH